MNLSLFIYKYIHIYEYLCKYAYICIYVLGICIIYGFIYKGNLLEWLADFSSTNSVEYLLSARRLGISVVLLCMLESQRTRLQCQWRNKCVSKVRASRQKAKKSSFFHVLIYAPAEGVVQIKDVSSQLRFGKKVCYLSV